MSSLLVVLPPEAPSGSSEYLFALTADGRSLARSGQAAAALLPAAPGAGSQVVAVVPASALSWHRIEWPRGVAAGSQRLRTVIEGTLEEQLLDEPEALHFAVEPETRAGTSVWVAACDRAWLRGHVHALEAAGRGPHRIVPEAAPEGPAALSITNEAGRPWLTLRSASGVQRLPLGAEALALLPPLEGDTLLLAEPAVSAQAESLLQRPVVLQTPAQRWVQAAHSPWNLAQFDLTRSGSGRWLTQLASALGTFWRAPAWQPARWAGLALVLAHLVGLNAWAWQERQSLQAQRAEVQNLLTRTFPQVKVVIDAPLQMERELMALRQATGAPSPADLESLLAAWSQATGGAPVQAVEYDTRGLRVRTAPGAGPSLDTVQATLRTRGVQAQQEGAWWVLRAQMQPSARP